MRKILFSILCIVFSVSALAQKTATSVVNVKIPEALDLSVTTGNTIDFDFSSDLTLLTSGIEKLNAVILTYNTNKPWFLSINATTGNFTGGDGTSPMPSSVIQFKNNAGGTYMALSTTSVSLSGTSGAKNPKGSSTVGVDYKLTPGFGYPSASDYSIGITYTISTI
jgi:hypothetical protein